MIHSSYLGPRIRLRFAAVTLLMIGCQAEAEEPTGSAGFVGNSGGSGGAAPTAGATFGGNLPTAGSGTLGAGRGGDGAGGSAGKASTGGTASGGTTGTAGGGGSAGIIFAGGMPGTAGTPAGTAGTSTGGGCEAAKGSTATPLIYDGSGQTTCTNALTPPRQGYWYTYNDKSGTQMPADGASGITGEMGGKGGAMDCAMHTSGKGFTKWGAGIGFDVHVANSVACAFDATVFAGLRFYAKGTTTGTHGDMYAAAPNTIRVKFKATNSTALGGDEFGGWCKLTTDWTQCDIPFASVKQEGFGTAGNFLQNAIQSIQFQASKEGMEDMPPEVTFDFWIDNVAFY